MLVKLLNNNNCQTHLVTKRSNADERAAETLTSGSPPCLRPGFNSAQHDVWSRFEETQTGVQQNDDGAAECYSHCDITVSTDVQEGLESKPGSVPADL